MGFSGAAPAFSADPGRPFSVCFPILPHTEGEENYFPAAQEKEDFCRNLMQKGYGGQMSAIFSIPSACLVRGRNLYLGGFPFRPGEAERAGA